MSNPDIANAGVKFAAGDGRVRGKDAAWSVRNALRRLGALDIDLNDDAEVAKALGGRPSNSQKVAIKQFLKAQKEDADTRAAEFITENAEGKLVQANINADIESLKNKTIEEIESDLTRVSGELAALSQGSADGATEPSPSGAGAETETAPVQPTAAS